MGLKSLDIESFPMHQAVKIPMAHQAKLRICSRGLWPNKEWHRSPVKYGDAVTYLTPSRNQPEIAIFCEAPATSQRFRQSLLHDVTYMWQPIGIFGWSSRRQGDNLTDDRPQALSQTIRLCRRLGLSTIAHKRPKHDRITLLSGWIVFQIHGEMPALPYEFEEVKLIDFRRLVVQRLA